MNMIVIVRKINIEDQPGLEFYNTLNIPCLV